MDEIIEFESGERSRIMKVRIIDDNEWEPDEDFFVELYHPDSGERLDGKDTRARVTIIDDDEPGIIGF